MSKDEVALLVLKGLIGELPQEVRASVNQTSDELRRVIQEAGDPVGMLALALVTAEAAVKQGE